MTVDGLLQMSCPGGLGKKSVLVMVMVVVFVA